MNYCKKVSRNNPILALFTLAAERLCPVINILNPHLFFRIFRSDNKRNRLWKEVHNYCSACIGNPCYGNLPSSINSLYMVDSIRFCAVPHLLHMPVSFGFSFIFLSHSTHLSIPFLNPMSELFPNLDNNYIWNFWFLGNFKKLDSKLRYDWMYYSSNLFLKAGILIIFISISFFFFVRWNMILLCKICI